MIDKESTSIKPEEVRVIKQDDISDSNELKWKLKGKKYFNFYKETKDMCPYNDLVDGDPKLIMDFIVKIYFDSKILDATSKNLYDCISKLINTIEWNTEKIDKDEFIAKLEAMIDFIKEHDCE